MPMQSENIILTGFMGSGKSTIGAQLASELGCRHLDTDYEIEKSSSMSIAEIFEVYGEHYFRSLERDLLRSLDRNAGLLISTGGGMPCSDVNLAIIKHLGCSFYLKLSENELIKRLWDERQDRPLLSSFSTVQELEDFIRHQLPVREVYYEQSDYNIDANQSKDAIISEITDLYRAHS